MKKSKLLLLTPIAALAAAIPSAASCSKQGWTADDVASAIMDPVNLPEAVPPKDTFIESIGTLNERDKQKELIYEMFSLFTNEVDLAVDTSNKTFAELYKDNIVEMVTNISKCSLEIIENQNTKQIQSTFLGYVSFVFIKDYNDSFKKNDYVMYTIDIDRVIPETESWGTEYSIDDYDIGIRKIRSNGYEYLDHIEVVWTSGENFPPNSHNWKK